MKFNILFFNIQTNGNWGPKYHVLDISKVDIYKWRTRPNQQTQEIKKWDSKVDTHSYKCINIGILGFSSISKIYVSQYNFKKFN